MRLAEYLDEVANTNLLFPHEIQEAQAGVVTKSLEEAIKAECPFRHSSYICLDECLVNTYIRFNEFNDRLSRMKIDVRPAMHADLGAVQELLASSNLLPIEDVTHFIDQYVVAITNAGDVIGIAGVELHGDAGLLRSVAVEDKFRGSGVGQRLIAGCREKAKLAGLSALYLLTTDAMEYWLRRGFVPIARDSAPVAIQNSQQWAISCPQSAIAMKHNLIDSK